MTIRRSSLAVSGSRCSSSEGKSSGCRPIQAPTYRFGGSVTLTPIGGEKTNQRSESEIKQQYKEVQSEYDATTEVHATRYPIIMPICIGRYCTAPRWEFCTRLS